ncbi:MAG TPA: nitrogenase stabilizing/protective protein NifW [Polyangiaceae bacterium]|nr:nitrogenase stabilizing/protective protein NifW [Polyangiaceae bacterium]
MSVLDDLRKLSAAEEIFRYLGVPFEPAVVNVCRLHILRRMGQYLAQEPLAGLAELEVLARCRVHLQAAYNDFVARSPIEERVFKVHRDAVRPKAPKPAPFVPLGALRPKK